MSLLAKGRVGEVSGYSGRKRPHAPAGLPWGRGIVTAGGILALALLPGSARALQQTAPASYRVEMHGSAPPRITVRATLPSEGAVLTMASSHPADVPEVADAGWPGLIRNLAVTDPDGRAVGVTATGSGGWTLARAIRGPLRVQYDIDYAPLARRGWPAPREAAYADSTHLIVIGRSLFITTPAQQTSEVRFSVPRGWQPALPWAARAGAQNAAAVASPADLTENLLAFLKGPPEVVTAAGFEVRVVALGHWQPARGELRQVLAAALPRAVTMVGFEGQGEYLVVLLPQAEDGGESFRASFALNSTEAPSPANRGRWGNTLTHEIFHYWNGWRLRGADYPSSQWFQEGVTEYAANLALVSSGVIGPDAFYAKLASHVANYRRLGTPLDAPGTRKGPPLYSGGALVAFIWDATIREQNRGERGLGEVLRALLRETGQGARPYEWSDVQAALEGAAPNDWAQFHRRFIHGTKPLPLAATFSRLGLVLVEEGDGSLRVREDPAASDAARALRRAVIGGDR